MPRHLLLSVTVVVALVGGYFLYRGLRPGVARSSHVIEWLRHPDEHPDWALQAGTRCADAPFLFPTDGLVGYLWDDSFHAGHHHQGIDIFAGTSPGQTAVIAAYDGYLTRLLEWKSAVILRLPDDPLHPGRQIWLYYTHMADQNGSSYIAADFPPGTSDTFIPAGTLLGYQGNYSGDANNPVGVHLHFSIVLDDGNGSYLNELEINNTLNPSPYFGLALNAQENPDRVPVCGLR